MPLVLPSPPLSSPTCVSPFLLLSPVQYECEDVVGDGRLFDALGVGLGRAEMYSVSLAVKQLGEDPAR